MQPVFFRSAAELRQWFADHHDKAPELWIGFYRKDSGKGGVTYPEALDTALCYGWIDGVRKKVDDISYTNRFTPRRSRSNWSLVNIRRVQELTQRGLMSPAGLKAFEARAAAKSGIYSFEQKRPGLSRSYKRQFRANKAAWKFFNAQPPGYRRVIGWWIMSARKEQTRLRRLATLMAASATGCRIDLLTGNAKKPNPK